MPPPFILYIYMCVFFLIKILFELFSQHVNDQPEELVFDNLHSVAYNGSALGLTILGPEENVK